MHLREAGHGQAGVKCEGSLAVCGKVPVYQDCAPVRPHHGQAGQGRVAD